MPPNLTALDVRLRREARRGRAAAQARASRPEPAASPPPASPPPAAAPPGPTPTTEELAAELSAWLRAMHSFVLTLGAEPGLRGIRPGPLQSSVSAAAPVLDPMEVLDDIFYTHQGGKDAARELHGHGVLEYEDGSSVAGTWRHGLRHGTFKLDTARPESLVTYLEGEYREDRLEGLVRLQAGDGTWQEGWYRAGVLHGFSRSFDEDKNLTFLGMYRNGRPFGTCWRIIPGGGCVVGRVNEDGELSGPGLAYLYPDFSTALTGSFQAGELVTGQAARLVGVSTNYGAIKVPAFSPGSGQQLPREVSTQQEVTSLPLVPDPYEAAMVTVRQSCVPGAEEGLFAARAVSPGTVLAFYNGVRYQRPLDGPQTWQNEANAYKIFDPTCKDGVVNIPPKYHQLAAYCASLAHKTNHSFVPNCEFGEFRHPRWGLVPCIVTQHAMEAGEEAFVWYGYDLDYCPDWYLAAWEQQAFTVPDSMRSEYGLS